MTIGTGKLRYKLVEDWPKIPRWWRFDDPLNTLDASGPSDIAVNSEGLVYVFNRGAHPVAIFDADGNFVSSWGEGQFRYSHGIHIGPDDMVYLVDRESQVVMKFTPDGKLLMTLGNRDKPSPTNTVLRQRISPEPDFWGMPFNLPTMVAPSPSGNLFVSDGYGNRRVHKFTADGTLLRSWGAPGNGPGQFALVHMVEVDSDGRVWVCDRENDRIQIFDEDGKFLDEWTGFVVPSDLHFGKDGLIYLAETGNAGPPPKLSVWSMDRKLLWSFQEEDARKVLGVAHGIGVDPAGNMYVADVYGKRVRKFVRG